MTSQGGKRILVVEDDLIIVGLIHDYLAAGGHKIEIATSAEAALECLAHTRYDLITLDYVLPGMNGLKLLDLISERLPGVPIVVTTGQGDEGVAVDFMKHGAVDYLSKCGEYNFFRRLVEVCERELEKADNKKSGGDVGALRKMLLDAIPASAILIDSEGVVLKCNERSSTQGMKPGVKCYELLFGENRPCESCKRNEAIAACQPISIESGESKCGENVHWLPVGDGMCIRYSLEDDAAKNKALADIDHLAMMGRLSAGVSHDFRNMLATIMGYSELQIRSLPKGTREREHACRIYEAAKRATDLTSKVTDFARKKGSERKLIDLKKVMQNSYDLLFPSCKRIGINLELPGDKLILRGDETLLQSAFLNLGLNARDAMPDGGDLKIKVKRLAGNNGEPGVKIVFSDTGLGISPDLQARIFEPFFTTKREDEGTGLGLANVRQIVESHGGEITVSSTVGKGTEFSITLPLEQVIKDEADNAGQVDAAGSIGSVMLVDDDLEVLEMVGHMLTVLGFKVCKFTAPLKALEYYRKNWAAVDTVLLDGIMPEMSGPQLFKEIRTINPKAKAFFLSAYFHALDTEALSKQGAMGFMEKPVDCQKLGSALKDSISVG